MRVLLWTLLLAAGGFAVLNVVAYHHARSFVNFEDAGRTKTKRIQDLSPLEKLRVLVTGITLPRPRNETSPLDHEAPFSVHRFPARDGLLLEGWLLEAKGKEGFPLVILFHGYSHSKGSLLPEALMLHDSGYPVLLVDFRGSGGSQGNRTTIGYTEAEDVIGAVTFVRGPLAWPGPVVLHGRSMGAVAVLRALSLEHLPVQGVILECPFDRLITTLGHRFQEMGLPAFPFAHLLVFWAGVQLGYDGFAFNPVQDARHVHVPTLVMTGGEDPRARLPEVTRVFENLSGPKQMHVFDGMAHEPYFEAVPDAYRGVILPWLEARRTVPLPTP